MFGGIRAKIHFARGKTHFSDITRQTRISTGFFFGRTKSAMKQPFLLNIYEYKYIYILKFVIFYLNETRVVRKTRCTLRINIFFYFTIVVEIIVY